PRVDQNGGPSSTTTPNRSKSICTGDMSVTTFRRRVQMDLRLLENSRPRRGAADVDLRHRPLTADRTSPRNEGGAQFTVLPDQPRALVVGVIQLPGQSLDPLL